MGNWRKKMKRAKKEHRPSLKDWSCDGLAKRFPSFVASLTPYTSFNGNDNEHPVKQIPVVLDAETLSTDDFHNNYEGKMIPSVIRNIPLGWDGGKQTEPWRAVQTWSFESLRTNSELHSRSFKCGEDDDGYKIKVKLKHFLRYLESNKDDSPLYIFCSTFDEDKQAKCILSDYTVPSYFSDDLFRLTSEARRPPYRWWLIGPERSGTCVHIDPLATSAWNTLVVGQKRWVLFPPHVPKHIVKGRAVLHPDEDDEAVHYFMTILPRIKHRARSMRHNQDYKDFSCFEFTQFAGETVFIPNGWWHAVLNLTDSVAVTQNYCSPRNFDKVWTETRSGRKRLAWKWLQTLEEEYPELARRAKKLNERDQFRMKYDPKEIKRQERKEHQRKLQRCV
jgi:histone arginine demethylase JMJD6